MGWTIERTLKHACMIARHLNNCDPQNVTLAVLLELGVPTKQEGFYQLLNSIVLFCEDPSRKLVKDIYPEAGSMCMAEENALQTEQAIRSAISAAWGSRDEEVWAYYFAADGKGKAKKPSNAEFISRIGWFVRLCQGCAKEVDYARK